MSYQIKLLDFKVYNKKRDEFEDSSSDSELSDGVASKPVDKYGRPIKQDTSKFTIQMFGLDERGKTYCMFVKGFEPFFYIKVPDHYRQAHKNLLKKHILETLGDYHSNSLSECKLLKKEELYGFTNHKKFKFVKLAFKNTSAMNKIVNMFYNSVRQLDGSYQRFLKRPGYEFNGDYLQLYESNIPPMLRYFHIRDVSPSGWVKITKKNAHKSIIPKTSCDVEFSVKHNNLIALNDKEENVPYKICSFDIEASSSHGDFPIPEKDYKKLAINILDYYRTNEDDFEGMTIEEKENYLVTLMKTAFGYGVNHYIDVVYLKKPKSIKSEEQLDIMLRSVIKLKIKPLTKEINKSVNTIDTYYSSNSVSTGENDGTVFESEISKFKRGKKCKFGNEETFLSVLESQHPRDLKLAALTESMNKVLPAIEGDKVTFIGSTFLKYGQTEPYLNHCIALNTCDDVEGATIERYKTEREVLLAWTDLIQRENPDIIIGYNIFGFDYNFMFKRARELGNDCVEKFLMLSRNNEEMCGEIDRYTGEYKIEEMSITIASGTHELNYIKMDGRIQIDLFNYFRREYNLTSYKLDYVSGHFIGDKIKKYVESSDTNSTKIYSNNLTGLKVGHWIHIEEIGHTTDYYDGGGKFNISELYPSEGYFVVNKCITPDRSKTLRWCLAKDDVTHHDIFRMTNEGPTERAVIAKYCIQDCNLVHNLLRKIDVVTGFVEMAKICSVPIQFLVLRGQGIKLFSFIAKKCREADVVIPVLEKKDDGGYEGAIVLPPKTGLYLDEPVACVDYSSLYPSSMISENLSHDSKVWSKEYDLQGNLIKETGVKDASGNFIYDNLEKHEYVDVEYETYEYLRKTPKSAAVKTKVGRKICRFAQFPNGKLAIMPRILKELLAARKATRTSANFKTIKTGSGIYTGLVINKTDTQITIKDKDGNIEVINNDDIQMIEDTYNDFMKNVLDKRQLAIKVTANSLYGQCGAKTSSFYEKDVAASTTAIGRKLLTYGKRIIEEVYGDRICETKYGTVHSHAEYVYGDTDSVFMSFKLTDPETGKKIVGKEALKHTIELAKEAGELATKFLKAPHDLEYEKTFMPFCLLSKKRYVGMLYEEDPDSCYRKSMGIVLKRRDNAPIVKDVYGGIIDILMKEKDVQKAVDFTKECLQNIVDEKYPLDKLIITKSLNGFYKNPQQIAHKVLADRMAKRDPGNKPSPGDRIPFAYIQTKGKVKLQGDKVEHPDYIVEHKLKPDYNHYITNQIMKPVQQVFALVLEDLPCYKKYKRALKYKMLEFRTKFKDDPEKAEKKCQDYRNKEVKRLIFDDALNQYQNTKNRQNTLSSFWK
jgi:DNA polymerase elongation subunit (family B)